MSYQFWLVFSLTTLLAFFWLCICTMFQFCCTDSAEVRYATDLYTENGLKRFVVFALIYKFAREGRFRTV